MLAFAVYGRFINSLIERYFSDSNAAKWFCDFDLTEPTTDYSVFSELRAKIGTKYAI